MGRPMTIKDIARESGYAVGTVSRALNDHPNVSPKAREKIMEVVRRYGFQPNSNAKRLKQQASHSIAVVVKGAGNLLFAGLVEQVQTLVESRGYAVIVHYLGEDDDEVEAARLLRAERKPQGVLFLGGNRDNFRRGFAALPCPCALVTTPAQDLGFENLSSVSTDDVAGARAAANYLLDAGHRRIGVIGGESSVLTPVMGCNTSQMRFVGFYDALVERGVPFEADKQSVVSRYSLEGGYQGAKTLLERCDGLTAIFAMSDVMAIGAMRAVADQGLRVPQDVSVLGYDGIALGGYCIPKLTTIRQDGETLARRGVEVLLDAVEGGKVAVHEIVPFTVVEGESVKKRR